MIYLALAIAIVWLTHKTVTRGQPNDATVSAIGLMIGLLFGVISGFSFIAGGWWSAIGYGFFAFTLASWIRARKTLPEDIDQTLAEYEAMKPELDELQEDARTMLKQNRLPLP